MSISVLNQTAVREAKNILYHTCDAGRLSVKDLLILILEPTIKNRSLSLLVDEIMEKGISYLSSLSEFELSMLFGLSESQSIQLMSVFELARRVNMIHGPDPKVIRSPQDVHGLVQDLKHFDREHFVVIYLNTKNHVTGRETISIGSLNSAIVHPREVFKAAIRRGACSVVFAHNHPSQDPSPSPEDINITERLAEAGVLLGIEVLDHVIIGGDKFYSLKEHGHFPTF